MVGTQAAVHAQRSELVTVTPALERPEPAAARWGRRQVEKRVLKGGRLMPEGSDVPATGSVRRKLGARAEAGSWSVQGPWGLGVGVGSGSVWGPRAAGSWLSQGEELPGFVREPWSVLWACGIFVPQLGIKPLPPEVEA